MQAKKKRTPAQSKKKTPTPSSSHKSGRSTSTKKGSTSRSIVAHSGRTAAASEKKTADTGRSLRTALRDAVKHKRSTKVTPKRHSKVKRDWLKPYHWKPGQSGNPNGRPKSNPVTEAYRDILEARIPGDPDERTFAQAIAQVMLEGALLGSVKATREITDRVEGRARQSLEINTPAGRPLEVNVTSALDKVYGPGAEAGDADDASSRPN
jgi:hypothetical protein